MEEKEKKLRRKAAEVEAKKRALDWSRGREEFHAILSLWAAVVGASFPGECGSVGVWECGTPPPRQAVADWLALPPQQPPAPVIGRR